MQTGQQRIRLHQTGVGTNNRPEEENYFVLDENEEEEDDDYTPDSTGSSSSPPTRGASRALRSPRRHKSTQGGQLATSGHFNEQLPAGQSFAHQPGGQKQQPSSLPYQRLAELQPQSAHASSGHLRMQQGQQSMIEHHQQQWPTNEQVSGPAQLQKMTSMSHAERLKFSSSTPPGPLPGHGAHLKHRLSDSGSPDSSLSRGLLSASARRRLPLQPGKLQQAHQLADTQPTSYQLTGHQLELSSQLELAPGTSFDSSCLQQASAHSPEPTSGPSVFALSTKMAALTMGATNGALEHRSSLIQKQEQLAGEHEQRHQVMSNLFGESQQQQLQLINQVETNQVDRYRHSTLAHLDSLSCHQHQHQQQQQQQRPNYSSQSSAGLQTGQNRHSSVQDKMLLMRDLQASSGSEVAQNEQRQAASQQRIRATHGSSLADEYLLLGTTFGRRETSAHETDQLMALLAKQRTNELNLDIEQQHLLGGSVRARTDATNLLDSSDLFQTATTNAQQQGDTSSEHQTAEQLMYQSELAARREPDLIPLLTKAGQPVVSAGPNLSGELPLSFGRRPSNFTNEHLYGAAQADHYDHYERL